MLRTALHRLLAHPWWVVLAATAMVAFVGGLWVAPIMFILAGGAVVTARNLVEQNAGVNEDPVATLPITAYQGDDPWNNEMGLTLSDHHNLEERITYEPEFRDLPGNIWHRSLTGPE